jgi:hypothetical protein
VVLNNNINAWFFRSKKNVGCIHDTLSFVEIKYKHQTRLHSWYVIVPKGASNKVSFYYDGVKIL